MSQENPFQQIASQMQQDCHLMVSDSVAKILGEYPLPIIHPKLFAERIGTSSGVVEGWTYKGYVPTIKIGKYRFINLVALAEMCRESA